jgi:hypothetical protein
MNECSVVSEPALVPVSVLASKRDRRNGRAEVDYENELESLGAVEQTGDVLGCRELRLYRPDGTLSAVYLATFDSDANAISDAERMARCGYQVEVWRNGMRIDRVLASTAPDTSDHQPGVFS